MTGLQLIHMCLATVLCASLSGAAPVIDSVVVMVKNTVRAHHGQTVTLPCWLQPPQSAEALEVRWYRNDDFDTSILSYRAKTFETPQETSYVGRASFGLKDAASGGLKEGDVSLKLVNVTLQDDGAYTCYVSSDKGYDKGKVGLSVTATGTSPFMSVVWKQNDLVNLSCESDGWYPRPQLRWSEQKQNLSPKSLEYREDSSGLASVHSWLLVSRFSEVSCSVGLSDGEAKEARVRLEIPVQPAKQESHSLGSGAGWVAFALLLITTLVLLGVLYFKRKALFASSKKEESTEENCSLLPKNESEALAEANNHYENVTLDQVKSEYLTIKDGKLRDTIVQFPDGPKVTCLTAVRGRPGFSSGKHYWEVSLGNAKLGLKQSWWVGVTSATVLPWENGVSPSSSNGFWFLSSSPARAESLQFNTEPEVLLPVRSRPQTVGVYLNYDSRELSFYNVDDKKLIGSLKADFSGEVFPLFNPGRGDKAPMEILQRTAPDECDDTGNYAQSTPQEAES
uniref:Butyrophilin subfamily 1 member A1-like n=1 Tax=Monopterus albus TaxID=43700 RepID=A0A3Q3IUA5_MONAL|nr:butyrophilin subfamily 1 member A1-like isoform X1 [Monopterus albus]